MDNRNRVSYRLYKDASLLYEIWFRDDPNLRVPNVGERVIFPSGNKYEVVDVITDYHGSFCEYNVYLEDY
jgi:hypothetical protein